MAVEVGEQMDRIRGREGERSRSGHTSFMLMIVIWN